MQSTLKITALAATALLAINSPATAEVKFYGKAHVSVSSLTDHATLTDGINIQDHASRFGVKGDFELNNNMKAIFGHEVTVDYAQDSGSYTDERNTYVGLRGSFGTIKVGNLDMPHKVTMKKAEMWGDTNGDFNAVIGTDTRQPGVIQYNNKFGGASVILAYAPAGSATANTGAGIDFDAGPVNLGLAYESNSGAAQATSGIRASMNFGAGSVHIVYNSDGGATTNTQYVVSGKYKFGEGMSVAAQYGQDQDASTDFTAAGITKSLGEKTKVYALYASGDLKGFNPNATAVSLGFVQDF